MTALSRAEAGAETRLSPAPPGLAVRLRGARRGFGERRVLDGVDLDIAPGEFVAVVGRSGSGKSTLLRLIAGLDAPEAGEVRLDGAPAAARRTQVRVMFQDGRLLPWRRVAANVRLGLPRAAWRRAETALRSVGLDDRAGDWPRQLSGGQRQRVALARALATEPGLILLDEPLGALDALTRLEMQRLIEMLWQRHRFTAVLITHDVAEAALLGDRILLLEDGHFTMDLRVDVPRPREPAALGAIEETVLSRLLGKGTG
jgi:sulfonate transport system ATP-binding protein